MTKKTGFLQVGLSMALECCATFLSVTLRPMNYNPLSMSNYKQLTHSYNCFL